MYDTESFIIILFFSVIIGAAWSMWRAGQRTSIRPQDTPGAILRVVSDQPDDTVTMNLTALICTCANWQTRRRRFEAGTPMRLCRHLARYYARHLNTLPPTLILYAPLITTCALRDEGLPCGAGTEYGQVDEKAYILSVRKDELPEVRFYLGNQLVTYNLLTREWDSAPPPRESYFSQRARQLAETLMF